MDEALGAVKGERTPERLGYRSGCYGRTLMTRVGKLVAFLTVAEERSFSRAATRIGTPQSALSHTVRRLEERMGVRLLTRTTRNVVPTEPGERLMETLRPALNDIRRRIE
ncbi:DNA-binding transcriptional LysR family regulator [Sinorhizobium fredii]|nr:Mobile element protein [Sinorhizobium fredii CCBAU 25509]